MAKFTNSRRRGKPRQTYPTYPEFLPVRTRGARPENRCQQFGQRPVAVEQKRGALIAALSQYSTLVLFPINPKQLARDRESLAPGGGRTTRKTHGCWLSLCKPQKFLRPSFDEFARHASEYSAWSRACSVPRQFRSRTAFSGERTE